MRKRAILMELRSAHARENETLETRLARANEIEISVTGRKSGRTISVPIWFVWQDGTIYLLPVKGSDTQWYKNVLQKPSIQINAGNAKADFKVTLMTDSKTVNSVIEKFRAKYGASDVKKYYSKLDVAVVIQTR